MVKDEESRRDALVRRSRKAFRIGAEQVAYLGILCLASTSRNARLINRVRAAPADIFRWTDLAGNLATLDQQSRRLIRSHRLRRSNLRLVRSEIYWRPLVEGRLRMLAADLGSANAASLVREAISDIVRWTTIQRCSIDHDAHGGPTGYFAVAETVMQAQWDNVIFPIIRECDFTSTLELGCGYGRNTERLRQLAKSIVLVDVNQSCLDGCFRRFGDRLDGCTFEYRKTIGNSLAGVSDSSITLAYCWDTMVHFDKTVVADYVAEIARVLRPGGRAFLHYSNVGALSPDSNFATNPGTRSDMSAEIMVRYAGQNGLSVVSHRLSGRADGWGQDDLDCLTLLERSADRIVSSHPRR